LSPSRSSSASYAPVDAPEGTAAQPVTPPLVVTSASMVGLPRESRISLAVILEITCVLIFYHTAFLKSLVRRFCFEVFSVIFSVILVRRFCLEIFPEILSEIMVRCFYQ
jgi:hypothetical protein